ncbi:GHMP kinase [Saccharomonospora xinjiangensis]|uniref:GHMP family kinase ATP-binding protein n=1 Tax=Saccharomonospora xinjiangensis TaxID=75294 RepID=UPI00350ED01C
MTLPVRRPGSHAEFLPEHGADLCVTPAGRRKSLRAAALAIAECARITGKPTCGGTLRLSGTIPVGVGMGSSTCDVVATVRAVAASFAISLPQESISRLAVAAEQASDPLMLDDRPLLFAQREGRVLDVFGERLPDIVVVCCVTGGGRAVPTLALPSAEYHDSDLDAFERLRATLRRAVAGRDVALLGEVSTESARRNQRILPKAELGALVSVADRVGACGVQVAHSGNVAGLLFDPAADDLGRSLRRCVRLLRHHGIPVTGLVITTTARTEASHGHPHLRGDRSSRPRAARGAFPLPAFRDDESGFGAGRRGAPARNGGRAAWGHAG